MAGKFFGYILNRLFGVDKTKRSTFLNLEKLEKTTFKNFYFDMFKKQTKCHFCFCKYLVKKRALKGIFELIKRKILLSHINDEICRV